LVGDPEQNVFNLSLLIVEVFMVMLEMARDLLNNIG
jgi:hypothetical protein